MLKKISAFAIGISIALSACSKEPQSGEPTIEAPVKQLFDVVKTPVGDVNFPVGCNAEAAPLVERGVALLHHMMYTEANFVFSLADNADPDCAMAYWGHAMTIMHPLWPDVSTPKALERGLKLVEKSLALGGHTDRENAYLETTRAYFEDDPTLTERERLIRFENAWKQVSTSYPDDLEARAFYALALRATADNSDAALLQQREAGLIAESILKENPNHPGAHHYIIHSYDFPELAEQASGVADNYGKLTPSVPHATHMMTHIYTRLGYWEKAVEWNTKSAETAYALCIQSGEVNVHYTHALDYLAYARLQMGQDDKALQILEDAEELKPPYSELNPGGSAYAFAALPARYALERRDWQAAALLEPRSPATFPWKDAYDPYVAITHFARALAFSHLGRYEESSAEIASLVELRKSIANKSPYWAQQVEIQEMTARAWQIYLQGDQEGGLAQMDKAAATEASTQKHAVTPGEVLPATELYADMLLDAGLNEEALAAYQSALRRAPGRYNSLYGAGKAAMEMGDDAQAANYFKQLLSNAGATEQVREPAREAQAFLNGL